MSYSVKQLTDFCNDIMLAAGLSAEESKIFGDSLVFAEMRGISSHGLTRLSTYAKRVELGLVASFVEPEIVSDGGGAMLIDGKNGMGACVGSKVMQTCIERAKIHGSAFATVFGGNHFGCASYFTLLAAQNDMIGFAVANGPSAIAPTGSVKAMLGTNPVSISIPAKNYQPFTLDMATSAVARGKVALAKKNGQSIPLGWGVDSEGLDTTNPDKILNGGCMLPMAGAKGYGISLLVDILSSCLSGALNSHTMGSFYDFKKTQNSGYAFGAIDIGKIIDINIFKQSVDNLFDDMKAAPRAKDVNNIYIPGEIEYLKSLESRKNGITLSKAVEDDLRQCAKHYGVSFFK